MTGGTRQVHGLISSVLALLLALAVALPASASDAEVVAHGVLGQPDFTSNSCNLGAGAFAGVTAGGLCGPSGVTTDPRTGRLFVVDYSNGRVLSWANHHRLPNGEPADLVLGQPDFTTGTTCVPDPLYMCDPMGIVVDPDGRVYVADVARSRVLGFTPPLRSGQQPDLVLGQPDPGSVQCNTNGLDARSLCSPSAVAVDAEGRLYVADTANGRVLRYTPPMTTGQAADLVLGDCDLVGSVCPGQGPPHPQLIQPSGLAVDRNGGVFVADFGHARVLHFPGPLTTGEVPDLAIGQPDLTTVGTHCGTTGLSGDRFCGPGLLSLDRKGRLYVPDAPRHRVLRFSPPLTTGQSADLVFGQPDFSTGICNNGGLSARSLCAPYAVAEDFRGDLFVSDFLNNRVLRFDQSIPGTPPLPLIP